jgi:predicted alpha/beta hydrolase family esterase
MGSDTIDYRERAQAWGSMFFDGGMNGDFGSASMLGVWPEGLVYFGQFLATLRNQA